MNTEWESTVLVFDSRKWNCCYGNRRAYLSVFKVFQKNKTLHRMM